MEIEKLRGDIERSKMKAKEKFYDYHDYFFLLQLSSMGMKME